jgi:cytochrome P450
MATETELAPELTDAIAQIIAGSADPYPHYALLRERAPRLRLPEGTCVLTRRADVVAALRDARFGHLYPERQRQLWGDERLRSSRLLQSRLRWFLFMDPPDHGRLRGLVQKVFTPKTFEQRAPIIEAFVQEHLDRALATETFDLVAGFAHPLTVDTIGDLLGVPRADRTRFTDWGLVFEAQPGSDTFEQAERLIADYEDYFSALLAEKRANPSDDLLSALLAAEEDGDRLGPDEALATAFSLFGAGFDTTRHLIGNAMHALLQHPDQLQLLSDQPGLMRNAVEEFLRYDGSVQFTTRTALEDIDLDGERFARGAAFYLCLGSANRDPDAHKRPDELDIRRERPQPLTFGGGIHHCLGAAMGRLEARLALAALLARAPEVELAGSPRWRRGAVFRGLEELPLRR